jgi:PAP2 superfamily
MNFKIAYRPLYILTFIFSVGFLTFQFLRKRIKCYLSVRVITGVLIICVLSAPFNSTFSSIKQVIPYLHEFSWDKKLMQLDYFLHFENHPWRLLQPILNSETILRIVDIAYILWFLILIFFCFWMAWSSKRKLRVQFFIVTLLVWIVLGSCFGTIFSSAGPCYYTNVVLNDHNPYQELMETLNSIHHKGTLFSIKNQVGLWEAKQSNNWLPFGGISAMPSIHVAMALVFALIGWKISFFLGVVFTIYATIIGIGSVILCWHYAIDGYFSIVATLLLWVLVGRFNSRLDI